MTPQLITRFGLFVTLLAFLIGGCQSALPTLPPGQQSQVSLLVSLDSSTQIKREGWKDYQPVGFGTLVHPTDLLKTNGNVTLLCADLQTVKTLTNEGRNPCPFLSNNIVLQYDDMLFSPGVRGNTATTIPILISPRNTAILDAHPRLRWKDTGAASYIVEIRQGSKSVWTKKEVASTEITYPADAPMLEAGKDYLLVITAPLVAVPAKTVRRGSDFKLSVIRKDLKSKFGGNPFSSYPDWMSHRKSWHSPYTTPTCALADVAY
jgi:hypothetical protein